MTEIQLQILNVNNEKTMQEKNITLLIGLFIFNDDVYTGRIRKHTDTQFNFQVCLSFLEPHSTIQT